MSQEGLCATSSTVVGVTFSAGAEVAGDTQEGFGKSTTKASYDGQQGAEEGIGESTTGARFDDQGFGESIKGARYDGQHEPGVATQHGGNWK